MSSGINLVCASISYQYLVCLQLGIVWVVLSGVRLSGDEMAVTSGLASESRLAGLAGRIRSEIVPACHPAQDKESLLPLRRPASHLSRGEVWAGQMQSWQNGPVCLPLYITYQPDHGLIGFLRNGHALLAPVLETGKQPTIHEKLCIITSPFIRTFLLVFQRILALQLLTIFCNECFK